MIRSASFLSALVLAAAPAAASNYTATLASPSTARFIARDITWNCGTDGCHGATEESRPLVLCESLAKRAGHIDSFNVDGRTLPPADLDRCNASAKARPGSAANGK